MTAMDEGSGGKEIGGIGWFGWAMVALAIIGLMIFVLFFMGRAPVFTGGAVKLWYGVFSGPEQSKHLTDWYTFTHIMHGPAFFFLLWLVLKKWLGWALPAGLVFVLAVGIEAGWEIFENTEMIINRYRTRTIDFGYTGDTILNSVGDMIAMIIGYLFSLRFSVWASIVLVVAVELGLLYFLRDNLTLNVIMLIHSFEAIKKWQQSGMAGSGGDLLHATQLALSPPVWMGLMAGRWRKQDYMIAAAAPATRCHGGMRQAEV